MAIDDSDAETASSPESLAQTETDEVTTIGSDDAGASTDASADASTYASGDASGDAGAASGAAATEDAGIAANAEVPDLSDDATHAALNTFLSNFTEHRFLLCESGLDGPFDRANMDGSEMEGIIYFLRDNILLNYPSQVEEDFTPPNGDNMLGYRVSKQDMNRQMLKFFGMEISDWSSVGRDFSYCDDEYYYWGTTNGTAYYGPAVATSVWDNGDGTISVDFSYYRQLQGGINYEVGDHSQYSMSIEQLNERYSVTGPEGRGTAVLEASRDGDAWSYHLVSYHTDV